VAGVLDVVLVLELVVDGLPAAAGVGVEVGDEQPLTATGPPTRLNRISIIVDSRNRLMCPPVAGLAPCVGVVSYLTLASNDRPLGCALNAAWTRAACPSAAPTAVPCLRRREHLGVHARHPRGTSARPDRGDRLQPMPGQTRTGQGQQVGRRAHGPHRRRSPHAGRLRSGGVRLAPTDGVLRYSGHPGGTTGRCRPGRQPSRSDRRRPCRQHATERVSREDVRRRALRRRDELVELLDNLRAASWLATNTALPPAGVTWSAEVTGLRVPPWTTLETYDRGGSP
jgi:hypothetical protein